MKFFNWMCKIIKQDLPADCRTIEHSSCFSLRIKGLANVTWVHYSLVVFADLVAASEGWKQSISTNKRPDITLLKMLRGDNQYLFMSAGPNCYFVQEEFNDRHFKKLSREDQSNKASWSIYFYEKIRCPVLSCHSWKWTCTYNEQHFPTALN